MEWRTVGEGVVRRVAAGGSQRAGDGGGTGGGCAPGTRRNYSGAEAAVKGWLMADG